MIEHQHTLLQAPHQVQVVAGDQHAGALRRQRGEQLHHFGGELGIEIAGGLVRHQQRRLRHHGPRDADALLLTAGKRDRQRTLARAQADLFEHGAHALADFLARRTGDDERQRDVVEYRAVHQQTMVLEHHAHAPAHRRNAARTHLREVLAVDQYRTLRRPFTQVDQP